MAQEDRSEDANPFGQIGDDLTKLKSRPISRGEVARKVFAGVILFVGTVALVVAFLMVPVNRARLGFQLYGGLMVIVWAVAFALYDGRLLHYLKHRRWRHKDEEDDE